MSESYESRGAKRLPSRALHARKHRSKSKKVLISIIMPAYNRAHCILESIRSVTVQETSVFDWELIVSDDASTDGTQELFEKRSNAVLADTRIRYMRAASNGGVNRARNLAMKRAQGDYLLFLDSDDFLVPNAFKILERYLPRADKVILFSTKNVKNGRRMTHVKHEGTYSYEQWLAGLEVGGEFLSIVHHSVTQTDLFDEDRFCFESFFWNRVIKKHGAFISPIVLRRYSFDSDNRVSIKLSDPAFSARRSADYVRYLSQWGPDYVKFGLRSQLAGLYLRTGLFSLLARKKVESRLYMLKSLSAKFSFFGATIFVMSYLPTSVFTLLYRGVRHILGWCIKL